MSALNVFVDRDAVHFVTDGGFFRANGKLVGYGSKVTLLPQFGGAWAYSGSAFIQTIVSKRMQAFADFDSFIVDRHKALGSMRWFAHCVVITGWSTAQRRMIAYLSESAGGARGATVQELTGYLIRPSDAGLNERLAQRGVALDFFDPIRDPFEILDCQRIEHSSSFFRRPAIGVGGVGQITTIDASGVFVRTIGRWPDRLGQPIARA